MSSGRKAGCDRGSGPRIYIVGSHSTGKCVSADTFIPTSNGLMTAAEVYAQRPRSIVTESGVSNISSFHDEGETSTFRVTTTSGHQLEGRPNHRIRTIREGRIVWEELGNIGPGDIALLSPGASLWGRDSTLTSEEAEVLGAWIGDGSFDTSERPSGPLEAAMFSVGPNKIEYAKSRLLPLMASLGWTDAWIRPSKNRASTLYVSSKHAVRSRWEAIGAFTGSANKDVPDVVMRSPEPVVCAFLRGVFDTDGAVYRHKSGQHIIEWSSCSRPLAAKVHALLLRLGIISSIRWKPNHASGAWMVWIEWNRSKLAFANKIGLENPHKKMALARTVEHCKSDPFGREPIYGVRGLVREAWEALSGHVLTRKPYSSFYRARWGRHDLTWKQLERFVGLAGLGSIPETLRLIWSAGLATEKIVKTESSSAHCYDFTVDADPSYLSNGFVSHNTHLARWISKAYTLPLVTEVARSVLAEREIPLDVLRTDIERTADFQEEVFVRQSIAEDQAGDRFVSDRAWDNLAYAASHTISFKKIASKMSAGYAERLKRDDSIIFFVRPHRELVAQDGTRERVDWDELVRIDGMIKLLLEQHDIDYVVVSALSMSERVRTVRAVLRLYGLLPQR